MDINTQIEEKYFGNGMMIKLGLGIYVWSAFLWVSSM